MSVDSRPMSCVRGPLGQFVSAYKSHLRSCSTSRTDARVTDPFLFLNIVCPQGSYDVNVEPAKDDVIFEDADFVSCLMEKLLKSIYGNSEPELPQATVPADPQESRKMDLMLARRSPLTQRGSSSARDAAHVQLQSPYLARSPTFSPCPQYPGLTKGLAESDLELRDERDEPTKALDPLPHRKRKDLEHPLGKNVPSWRTSMYGEYDSDDLDVVNHLSAPTYQDIGEEEENLRNVKVSNPWTFAKLNAPFRTPNRKSNAAAELQHFTDLPTPRQQVGDIASSAYPSSDDIQQASSAAPDLVTPKTSQRSQHQDKGQYTSSSPDPFPFPLRARGKRNDNAPPEHTRPSDQRPYIRGALDTWVQKPPSSDETDCSISDDRGLEEVNAGPPDVSDPKSFVSARTLPRNTNTPSTDIPIINERPRRRAVPKRQQRQRQEESNAAPMDDPGKVWFDVASQPRQRRVQRPDSKQRRLDPDSLILREDEDENVESREPPEPSRAETQPKAIHPDLAITLDYEARKQLATQQYRNSLRRRPPHRTEGNHNPNAQADSSTNIPTSSPYHNRQKAAIAALHDDSNPPIFQPDDPRAYLIRTHHLEASASASTNPDLRKPRRRKTILLPFETLREENYIGDLVQVINIRHINFADEISSKDIVDEYIHDGTMISQGLTQWDTTQVEMWKTTLKELVKKLYRIEGMAPEEEMEGELECDMSAILQRHLAEGEL